MLKKYICCILVYTIFVTNSFATASDVEIFKDIKLLVWLMIIAFIGAVICVLVVLKSYLFINNTNNTNKYIVKAVITGSQDTLLTTDITSDSDPYINDSY